MFRRHQNVEIVSGLCYIWEGKRMPFPLHAIKVNARVIDTNARVQITQQYVFTNESDCIFHQSNNRSIECVYVFPLDEYSAVHEFDCAIDDRKVVGVVKPKKVARQEYDQAVSHSQQAALLEQQQENVFEVRVGSINQSNHVTINLSYLSVLTRAGPSHQLVLPMIVAPKYTPFPTINQPASQSDDVSNVVHTNTMCAMCHQSPIIGALYRCTVCKDPSTNGSVDWCQDCEDKNLHDASHSRMKIKTNQAINQTNNESVQRSRKPVPPHIAAHDLSHKSVNQSINQSTKSTNQLPRSFSFECDIEMASSIQSIECTSHPNMIITRPSNNQSNNQPTTAHASLTLTDSCSLQRDLVLSINQSKPFEPRCMVEYDPSLDICTVSLSFDIAAINQASSQANVASEYVFLLDRSGSMNGESIEALKQSMQLLIKSLPIKSRFQIIGFGSTYHCLFKQSINPSNNQTIIETTQFPESFNAFNGFNQPINQSINQSIQNSGTVEYNDQTCEMASNYLSAIAADMGGTEIAAPLELALNAGRSGNQSMPRNIFIVTDGQVSNINQLVSMVAKHRVDTRVFTIGIGGAVDRALCRKLARAGAGECEFVSLHHQSNNQSNNQSKQTSDMRSKVLRQLGRAMQPMLTDVKVDWGSLSNNQSVNQGSNQPQQCPRQPPAVFPGTRFGIYLLNAQLPESVMKQLKEQTKDLPNKQSNKQFNLQPVEPFEYDVVITARSNQSSNHSNNQSNVVTMTAKVNNRHLTVDNIVDRLAARTRIAELEQMHAETPFNSTDQSSDQSTNQSNDRPKLSQIDQEIETLGLRFGLASRATSFIVKFEQTSDGLDNEQEQVVQTDAEVDQPMNQSFQSFPAPRMMFKGAPGMRAMMAPAACALAAPMPMSFARSSFGAPVSSQSNQDMVSMSQSFALFDNAPSNAVSFGGFGAAAPHSAFGTLSGSAPIPAMASSGAMFGAKSSSLSGLSSHQETSDNELMKKQSVSQSTDPSDLFDELVVMQSASGVWKLNDRLIQIILAIKQSLDRSKLSVQALQSFARSINQSDEVIGTILVLKLLSDCFSDRSDDWQFIVGKAHTYVDQRCDETVKQTIHQKIAEMGWL